MNDRILFIIDTDHGAAGWQPDCTVRFGVSESGCTREGG